MTSSFAYGRGSVLSGRSNLWAKWTQGGPAGTMFSISDSRWTEEANFREWFKRLFVPSVSHLLTSGPVILFVEGHGSHISYDLVTTSLKDNIVIMCLPPHSSHVLQPLNVTCLGPIKQAWKRTLKEFQLGSGGANVTKLELSSLLKNMGTKPS